MVETFVLVGRLLARWETIGQGQADSCPRSLASSWPCCLKRFGGLRFPCGATSAPGCAATGRGFLQEGIMTRAPPPAAQSEFAHVSTPRPSLWKRVFRIIPWSAYAVAFVTLAPL